MLIVSALLYLLLSLLLTLRVYGHISFSRAIVFFLLVTVSLNLLVSEILSLGNALDQPWLFLFTQAIVSLIVGFLLWDPRGWFFKQAVSSINFEGIKPRGLDWMLLTLIFAILALNVYIGSLVPINNSDSLHTHLPRIYYWIQHGSLESWNAVTTTQVIKPTNLSLQGVWVFLLGGSEKFFFLVTWFALLAAIVIIYSIARQLGASYRGALLAALTSLSFPVIVLQTFSYQADVFVATFGLASVAFLLEYIRDKRVVSIFFSLLSLAVALGSKNTALFFLPFYVLAVLFYLIRRRAKLRRYLVFGGGFLLILGVFLSYIYVQNYLEGDQAESRFPIHRFINPSMTIEPGERITTNTLRYLYQGFSVDGLTGRLKLGAESIRAHAFRSLSERLGVDLEVKKFIPMGDKETFNYDGFTILNEDAAWYGPLSVILIPVACLVVLFGKDKTRKWYLLVSTIFLIAVFLMMSVLITGWSPTNGRYLIIPVMVLTPLLSVLLPGRRAAGAAVTIIISLSAAYLAFSTVLINDSRPLVTRFTLYAYQEKRVDHTDEAGFFKRAYAYLSDRVIEDLALTSPDRRDILHQTYYENLFHQSATDIPDIDFVNANVNPAETLYLYIRNNIIEYALFGVNKTRDLVPVNTAQQVPSGALLLVDKAKAPSIADGLRLLAENERFVIYQKP